MGRCAGGGEGGPMGDDARGNWPMLLFGATGLLLVMLVVLAGAVVVVPVLAATAGAVADACPTPGPTATMGAGTVTPAATTASASPTPGLAGTCVSPDANAVVYWAMQAVPHLYDCGRQGLDECYDAAFPQPFIDWWLRTCPGCSQWQNGNLQCVMLAGAIFGVAGLPLYWGPDGMANGIDFWYNYAAYPGWVEIPAAFEPGTLTPTSPLARGLPTPGDLIAWYDRYAPDEGHLAVVVQVVPPQGGQAGSVTFAEANGPGALVRETIGPDLLVQTWSGYAVAGYIRPITMPPAATPTPTGG
jgi:hypothetical protein